MPFDTFISNLTIPPEWFCVIAELVYGKRCGIEDLADRVSGTGCMGAGVFVFGPYEIPVRARTVAEWVRVIEQMCEAGTAFIIDEPRLRKLWFRYFVTVAALRPMRPPIIDDVYLSDAGYGYWEEYLAKCRPNECRGGGSSWDDNSNRIFFEASLDALSKVCPGQEEECRFYRNWCAAQGRSVEPLTSESEQWPCTISPFGAFWESDYIIHQSGYMLRCERVKKPLDNRDVLDH